MLFGGTVAAVWHFAGNPYCTSLYPSLAVGIPILVILTLMAKKPVADGHEKYVLALKELENEDLEEQNKPTIAH
ncbi:MAG: sodium:solute symporter family protein, partial [Desulfitobacterium hafniense]|nr:sodium:solute symporter family protein [Desulfitobacterium hafniense]